MIINRNKSFNEKKYDVLTVFVLIMAIIQAPLVYYYTSGLFAFFIVIPYLFVGLGLTIWLLSLVTKKSNEQITVFHRIGVFLTIFIGCVSFIFGEDFIEKFDWNLRRNSREEIIQLIKSKKLRTNNNDKNVLYTLDNWKFPLISNGGNKILISQTELGKLTVEFYINRGFLDHYSAFVYTNDQEKIKELEDYMSIKKSTETNKKLDQNWYRVSY